MKKISIFVALLMCMSFIGFAGEPVKSKASTIKPLDIVIPGHMSDPNPNNDKMVKQFRCTGTAGICARIQTNKSADVVTYDVKMYRDKEVVEKFQCFSYTQNVSKDSKGIEGTELRFVLTKASE